MKSKNHNIDYLKRKAKNLKKTLGISHYEALNIIAKDEGFLNWKSLINLSPKSTSNKHLKLVSKNESDKTIPKTKTNHKIDPYRNLLVAATNLLLQEKLISLEYNKEIERSESGHIITTLFNYTTVIIWNNIGYGELSISVWWKYNHDNHPQANLKGNTKERFRTLSPLAKRQHYKKFVGVVASCWLERKDGKFLQGKKRKCIFDIYTRQNDKQELENLPIQTPNGYESEGTYYI